MEEEEIFIPSDEPSIYTDESTTLIPSNEEEEILEPINPIYNTPYGALIINNDVLCTPTSLCTWKNNKPAVYCRLPQHTLNPVCKEKNIGLLDCYNEPTCGGMVPVSTTKKLLYENPQYVNIIQKEEMKTKQYITKQKKIKKQKKIQYILIIIIVVLIILFFILVWYTKKHHYKKKKRRVIQNRKH